MGNGGGRTRIRPIENFTGRSARRRPRNIIDVCGPRACRVIGRRKLTCERPGNIGRIKKPNEMDEKRERRKGGGRNGGRRVEEKKHGEKYPAGLGAVLLSYTPSFVSCFPRSSPRAACLSLSPRLRRPPTRNRVDYLRPSGSASATTGCAEF